MAKKNESDLNMISNEHQRLLKQKLKALGIDEKAIANGEQDPAEFIPTGVFEVDSLLGEGMGIPTGTPRLILNIPALPRLYPPL